MSKRYHDSGERKTSVHCLVHRRSDIKSKSGDNRCIVVFIIRIMR